MGVASRIGEVAKEKRITLKELSRRANIPYTTLYNAVNRDSKMDFETIAKVAAALGVEWVDLYPDTNAASKAYIDEANASTKKHGGMKKISFDEAVKIGFVNLTFKDDNDRAVYYMTKLNECGQDVAVQTALSMFGQRLNHDRVLEFRFLLKLFGKESTKEIADKLECLAQVPAYQNAQNAPQEPSAAPPDKDPEQE